MEKNPLGDDGDDRFATSHQLDLSFAIHNHGYIILLILAIAIVSLLVIEYLAHNFQIN